MRLLGVTQRVEVVSRYAERRDCLDQRWTVLLEHCGFVPVPIPNHPEAAARLVTALPLAGLVLSGGGDLASYGGDGAERDETERVLIRQAMQAGLPLLGVCRGMQVLADFFGIRLVRIPGHVAVRHLVETADGRREVNSYHGWGLDRVPDGFEATARTDDGFVEAMRHRERPIVGVMWHIEREAQCAVPDRELLVSLFAAQP